MADGGSWVVQWPTTKEHGRSGGHIVNESKLLSFWLRCKQVAMRSVLASMFGYFHMTVTKMPALIASSRN